MNINKHLSFFDPNKLKKEDINIIGCGAIGSNVAMQLAKLGIESLVLWDYDFVEEHNITNQVYDFYDIRKSKTDALEQHLLRQNPNIKIVKKGRYDNQLIKGIVILCVDSIEVRHKIAEFNQYNIMIRKIIDGRIGLETGQVYFINWAEQDEVDNYLKLTDFKDSEVSVPVSACGTELSVSPSVLMVASTIVACLINYVNDVENPTIINIDAFKFNIAKIK